MNNETEQMQKEAVMDCGSGKATGLQKALPCSNLGSLITYPLSFVVVFRTPNRLLLREYLEIQKEAQLRFFFKTFYSIVPR